MPSTPIFALRISEVYPALETTPDGLSPEAVAARLALYGPNALRDITEAPSLPRRVAAHATHPMALLLWVAGAAAMFGGRPVLGLVIWGVVLINAAFSFWQEYRAERAVTSLKHLLPAQARVIRGGATVEVPAADVVPGDVLELAEGDNIPADARVVEGYGLRANNATLTGEAMPALKNAEASFREGLTEVERPNLVFAGTSVTAGTGKAVVYATGMLTQFGRIANLTQAVAEPPSLLQEEMARITRISSLVALGLGATVLGVGITEVGLSVLNAFLLATGLIVAALPEGLLPTVTLSLAIAVQRLAGRGVLVKKLASVETLGTISVVCTDKSGTLTQNQMTVRDLWVGGRQLSVSGVGYEPNGEFAPAPWGTPLEADLKLLLTAGERCNNSRLNPPTAEHPQWTSLGDQTEAALRVLALKGRLDERPLDIDLPRVHELPFDARRKRMSTIHRDGRRGGEVAFVKGAPREVLQLCTQIVSGGEVRPLDNALRAEILAVNDQFARRALRVLALARRDLPPRAGTYLPENVERDLTFIGLAGMMDPPRPEVAAAVTTCREAGIRLVMITGDYGLTAESVARRVGMLAAATPRILTGGELDRLDDPQLQTMLGGEVIFARMAPEHKLRLVAAFQARGDVVAVIGDGVNDAPALRKADIGIAMGQCGTDVAKEAADVILTNDDFSAITSAIEEGRTVFDNLRKFITYIFASNLPEIVPFIASAIFKIPLALTVPQILAIDMGTDLLPALALSTERPEPNVMRRPPRQRGRPLVDRSLLLRAYLWLGGLETALCYIGFFAVYAAMGYTPWQALPRVDWLPYAERLAAAGGQAYVLATTVFHAGVVAAQIGNAFACRTEKDPVHRMGWLSNRFLLIGIAVEGVLILTLIYWQPLAGLFEHLPLPPVTWLGLVLYAPVLYVLEWLRKVLRRRRDLRGTAEPPEHSAPAAGQPIRDNA
jgi:Ca2+-transporting ATPase